MNFKKQKKGFAEILAIMMAIIVFAGIQIYMSYTIMGIRMAVGYDVMRQEVSEGRFLSQVLKETVLAQRSVSGATPLSETVGQTFVSHFAPLAGAGTAITYGFGQGQIPGVGDVAFATQFTTSWMWPRVLQNGIADTMFPSANRVPVVFGHLNGESASLAALEGVGASVLSVLSVGPFAEYSVPNSGTWPWSNPENLVTDAVSGPWYPIPEFGRYVTMPLMQNITYAGRYRVFGVSITNYNRIVYGMPSTASVPESVPAALALQIAAETQAGGHPLVVTRNNPSLDSTAFSDLWAASGTSEYLPYRYREEVSGAWDLFEYVFSWPDWSMPRAVGADGAVIAPANLGTQGSYLLSMKNCAGAAGHLFDFSSLTPSGSWFSWNAATKVLTIDISQMVSTTDVNGQTDGASVYFVQGGQQGSVVLKGASSGAPVVLVISQPYNQGLTVTFAANNDRPVLLILSGYCTADFGTASFRGGIFMDPFCLMLGSPTVYGTFAAYYSKPQVSAAASSTVVYSGAEDVTVYPDAGVRDALADVAR
jgi:hypothetical protein